MDFPLHDCHLFRAPHAFTSKKGDPVLILLNEPRLYPQLFRMYMAYQPRGSISGLPPTEDAACVEWVEGMIREGVNLVALSLAEQVIGHVGLFPINERTCEILAVVAPAFQNVGIGSHLVRCAIRVSREIGFSGIWLSVNGVNLRARHVYEKNGFVPLNGTAQSLDVEMVLGAQDYELLGDATVQEVMTRHVVTIDREATCEAAVKMLTTERIGALPVTDEERRVVGIVSETDLLLLHQWSRRVGEVMTRTVTTVGPDCTIAKVIQIFCARRIRCLPVVDSGRRLIGVLGRKDVLRHYAKVRSESACSVGMFQRA